MKPAAVMALRAQALRAQFYQPGHRWAMGDPKRHGDDAGALYEVYPDGSRSLFARFDSSSDAEAICTLLNDVCCEGVR